MRTSNRIVIQAPLVEIFSVASDLPKWPEFLPHYRYNKFLSLMPWGGIIKMAATRTGIPISWVSIYRIDAERREMQFEHLKAFTRGMLVVWTFEEREDGVAIEITHDLELKWPLIGGFVAKYIIGQFFIEHVATKTLAGLKRRMENKNK
jgi:hypothetical protein